MRIKEPIDKMNSTVGTHRNAECLLKITPTKHNMYVVNQQLEHFQRTIY